MKGDQKNPPIEDGSFPEPLNAIIPIRIVNFNDVIALKRWFQGFF